jgi:hypothetical protein
MSWERSDCAGNVYRQVLADFLVGDLAIFFGSSQ